jgi:hypothetical protein
MRKGAHEPGRDGVRDDERQRDPPQERRCHLIAVVPVHQLVAENGGDMVGRFLQQTLGNHDMPGVRVRVHVVAVVHQHERDVGQAQPTGSVSQDRRDELSLAPARTPSA